MLFESRVFYTSKDLAYPKEYEDAFQVDDEGGRAAIADGVASSIFARQWADVLTRSVLTQSPDLNSEADFKQWLADRRQEWSVQIDVSKLPWNQRQKLQQVGGAFSTLLWIELTPCEPSDASPGEAFRLTSYAVGDCSLFQVRDRQILRSFPLTTTAEFEADPISICSANLNRDHCLEFRVLDDVCLPGDLLVLCTDAVGKWAMTQIEAGTPPDWEAYWDMPTNVWLSEISELRERCQMRHDDTTLMLLRVGGVRPIESDATNIEAVVLAESEAPQIEADADEVDTSELGVGVLAAEVATECAVVSDDGGMNLGEATSAEVE